MASREEKRKSGIHLSAETDARFRKLLETETPRPGQKHVAKLIETQLRVAENKSGRCFWPHEILEW